MAIERLMVAAPLTSTEVGEEYSSLPPHMTLFPWFDMPRANWTSFNAAMHHLLVETVQPTISGGDAATFGGEQDPSEVRRLNVATPTFNIIHGFDIHAGVHNAVRRYGGDFDPRYVGTRWKPHVTSTQDFALENGDEVRLEEIAVFQRSTVAGIKMVKAVYKWEDPSL